MVMSPDAELLGYLGVGMGVGLVAFYRWYMDKADDFSGFNQLQRGASPGGDIGDIGVVGFVFALSGTSPQEDSMRRET